MILLKKLNVMNWLNAINATQSTDTSNFVKKLTMTQKSHLLTMIIVISILRPKNLIRLLQKI